MTPRTRSTSTHATGTRSLAMRSKRLSALSAQKNRMCSRIALAVGPAWESISVKNANSSMMMSQRTNTTVMDVAYAEPVARITSFTATHAGAATAMS
uniref:Uncharacterized protein n=1 Tax=Arundo donax TaxID=35708 RepID=A0A0A9FYQ4_ARUDO